MLRPWYVTNDSSLSQVVLPREGDMLPLWRNHRTTSSTIFLEICKLLSELAYSTAMERDVQNYWQNEIKQKYNSIKRTLITFKGSKWKNLEPRIEKICAFSSINIVFEQLRMIL